MWVKSRKALGEDGNFSSLNERRYIFSAMRDARCASRFLGEGIYAFHTQDDEGVGLNRAGEI